MFADCISILRIIAPSEGKSAIRVQMRGKYYDTALRALSGDMPYHFLKVCPKWLWL